jgi:hypothetical protein
MSKFFKRLNVIQNLALTESFLLVFIILDTLESTTATDNEEVIKKQSFITNVITAEPVLTLPRLQQLGTVEPLRLSNISAKVSAAFKQTRFINAGQTLVAIEPLAY